MSGSIPPFDKADALKILIFEMFASRDYALVIQAREYERRLALLNGEHSTLVDMRNDFVLRVVYDKDMDRMRDEANRAREAVESQTAVNATTAAQNRRNTVGWSIAILIAVVGWGLTLLSTFLKR